MAAARNFEQESRSQHVKVSEARDVIQMRPIPFNRDHVCKESFQYKNTFAPCVVRFDLVEPFDGVGDGIS